MVVFCSFELTIQDDIDLLHVSVPTSTNEKERIKILRQTKILDSSTTDSDYERFSVLSARYFKMKISALVMVDVKRVWMKSIVGLDIAECPREDAFCSFVILENAPPVLVIPDATKDIRFCQFPAVVNGVVRFYAGASIMCQGVKLGTLCVMDSVPREFDEQSQLILRELADVVSAMIEARREKVLEAEQELAKLVVGVNHHLKSPLKDLSTSYSRLEKDIRVLGPVEADNATNSEKAIAAKEVLMRSVNKFNLQAQQFNEQVEVALTAAAAYDRAKRVLQRTPHPSSVTDKQQAFVQAIPNIAFVSGKDLVGALQQAGCLSQHLAGRVDWEICTVLEHGEIQADVERLGVVLSSTMTLGAHGCERMKVNCSIDSQGDSDLVPLFTNKKLSREKIGRLMVNVTMSRAKVEPKTPHLIGGNTFVFTGLAPPTTAIVSPRSVVDAAASLAIEVDNDVIQQCNEVICSTILQAEHGGYRQQKTAFMDMEILLVSCWLPCKYRVASEYESARPQEWKPKGEESVNVVEITGMAAIVEEEEEEEEERDTVEDGRIRRSRKTGSHSSSHKSRRTTDHERRESHEGSALLTQSTASSTPSCASRSSDRSSCSPHSRSNHGSGRCAELEVAAEEELEKTAQRTFSSRVIVEAENLVDNNAVDQLVDGRVRMKSFSATSTSSNSIPSFLSGLLYFFRLPAKGVKRNQHVVPVTSAS